MTKLFRIPLYRLLAMAILAVAVSGCMLSKRLSQVGETPPLTQIQNPAAAPTYRPVSLPMPRAESIGHEPNSLWRAGARSFFKDQRAGQIGDILTVVINIDDKAKLTNSSKRDRNADESLSLGGFFGYEANLDRFLPNQVDNKNLIGIDGTTDSTGSGTIDRDEKIELKVAAVVTQVLPNGNLVVHGRQEVRVNFEVRELTVAGIIRPEDITSSNTITYEKIAEARVSYGGRGLISDVQQPRLGYQVLDILSPF
ncbi:MAG: flagellar basal body L-ring protein FlgH [Kiloniellales bacterium]